MTDSNTNLLPAERLNRIEHHLKSVGAMTVAELSEMFGVSDMTIRRDLKTLEEQGSIQRTHGGAIAVRYDYQEPMYQVKQPLHPLQKQAIARYAVEHFIEDNDIIILEGGTTIHAMIPHLESVQNLTIITNSLQTLVRLQSQLSQHTIISTGGVLRENSLTFVGSPVDRVLEEFHANKVFLSATGWTPDMGYTDPILLDTDVKRKMVNSADKVYMLIDSSKFGVKSLTTVLAAFSAHSIVTDSGINQTFIDYFDNNPSQLHIVPIEDPSQENTIS